MKLSFLYDQQESQIQSVKNVNVLTAKPIITKTLKNVEHNSMLVTTSVKKNTEK